jgi:hypothetical protein
MILFPFPDSRPTLSPLESSNISSAIAHRARARLSATAASVNPRRSAPAALRCERPLSPPLIFHRRQGSGCPAEKLFNFNFDVNFGVDNNNPEMHPIYQYSELSPRHTSPNFVSPPVNGSKMSQLQDVDLTLAAFWQRFESLRQVDKEREKLETTAAKDQLIQVSSAETFICSIEFLF